MLELIAPPGFGLEVYLPEVKLGPGLEEQLSPPSLERRPILSLCMDRLLVQMSVRSLCLLLVGPTAGCEVQQLANTLPSGLRGGSEACSNEIVFLIDRTLICFVALQGFEIPRMLHLQCRPSWLLSRSLEGIDWGSCIRVSSLQVALRTLVRSLSLGFERCQKHHQKFWSHGSLL